MSLPLWERGLKYLVCVLVVAVNEVAPLVGAWIEIFSAVVKTRRLNVAPLVGAWIEIPCAAS